MDLVARFVKWAGVKRRKRASIAIHPILATGHRSIGIQQAPSSKRLYIPQLIDRYLNDQKLMKDPKGLHTSMTVNFREGTRKDRGITDTLYYRAFTVSLGLSPESWSFNFG